MTDLISRADVFEIIDKAFSQPMRDGVTLYADICLMLNTLPTHANSRSTHERELISRADAIAAVKETKPIVRSTERNWGKIIAEQHSKELAKALKALPSADAVRPKCKWNKFDVGIYLCSNCNWAVGNEYNYCPCCGARMERR